MNTFSINSYLNESQENNKTFVNSLFPTSINEISNQNKIKVISIDPINIKEKKYNKKNLHHLNQNKKNQKIKSKPILLILNKYQLRKMKK